MLHAPAAVGEPQRADIIPDSTRELIRFEFMPWVKGEPRECFPAVPCNPRTGRQSKHSDTAESLAEAALLTGKSETELLMQWRRNFRPLVPAEFADHPEAFYAKTIERRRRRRRHARRAGGVLLVKSEVGNVAVAMDFFASDVEARRFARAIAKDAGELERAIADGVPGVVVLPKEFTTTTLTEADRGHLRISTKNSQNSGGANRTVRSSRRVARGGGNVGKIGGVA